MEFHHVSVMAAECMQALQPERGGIYVDCTAGGGGHSFEIARRLPEGSRIISLDRDDNAIAACTARLAPYADKHTIFHLINHRNLYYDRLVEILGALGIRMEVIGGTAFNEILQQLAKKADTEYIYEAFQNDMDESGKLVYDSNIHILNDFTVWFLRKCGFEWAEIDFEYVKGYVDYFRGLGYFEV